MLGIIAVSISLLVILAGLAMLAKSKKEELGKLYIFSSYAAIICGVGLFIGTNVNGLKRTWCGSHGSCSSYASQCGQGSCSGASACSYSGHGKSSCKAGGHASCGSGHGKSSCKDLPASSSKCARVMPIVLIFPSSSSISISPVSTIG